MANFKIVKKKAFKTEKAEGTTYVLAHKGRVFNTSTLYWEKEDGLKESADGKVLTIDSKGELIKDSYVDDLGQLVVGYKLMPVFDLAFGEF